MRKRFYIVALVLLAVALPALAIPYIGRNNNRSLWDDNKKSKSNCNSNGRTWPVLRL
jgi:hypothetical protein